MTYHGFSAKLNEGQLYEEMLDRLFVDDWVIRLANREEEARGIDRWFTHPESGEQYSVQYKSDSRAWETGNAFVELMSVDEKGIQGWAYSCEADLLEYYVPQRLRIYELLTASLFGWVESWRERLERGDQRFAIRNAQNLNYKTQGLLVPFCEFERATRRIYQISRVSVSDPQIVSARLRQMEAARNVRD
jgi:hypothetical protein